MPLVMMRQCCAGKRGQGVIEGEVALGISPPQVKSPPPPPPHVLKKYTQLIKACKVPYFHVDEVECLVGIFLSRQKFCMKLWRYNGARPW